MSPQAQPTFRITGQPTLVLSAALLIGQVTDWAELRGQLARTEASDLDLIETRRLPHYPRRARGADICPYCGRARATDTTSGRATGSRMSNRAHPRLLGR